MKPIATDRTQGHIVGVDGELLQRPTTILGADTAAIVRAYFFWAMSNHLEPELACKACFDFSRDSRAKYEIDEDQIVIVCDCQMRYFKGRSLPPAPVALSRTAPGGGVEGQGVAEILLSDDAASLLRKYKTVLLEHGLMEALRCNACYELGQSDGCAARVTSNLIEIRCRCSHRTFRGMSI